MMLLSESDVLSPVSQIALDDWLWQQREAGTLNVDVLRVWEPRDYTIVLGRGSHADAELNREQVNRDRVLVARRITGGAAVVCGPGCLMYTVIADKTRDPALHQIATSHARVLGRVAESLRRRGCQVQRAGVSDLILDHGPQPRKFSGNSMRLGRQAVLYHGTLLYAMDLSVISHWLRHPTREPDYREHRPHDAFLANIPLSRDALEQSVIEAFGVTGRYPSPNEAELAPLIAVRYGDDAWTYCL